MATTTGLHNVGDGNGATTTTTRRVGRRWTTVATRCSAGIDVGKTGHYAVALNRDGERLTGTDVHQDEAALRRLFTDLTRYGKVLVIVDQPRNIGAPPVAVARDCCIDVAFLPGLRMRRIADLYPGNGKTDAKDAFIIADAARTLPDTLLSIGENNDLVEGLRMLAGFDADLAVDENRLINRLRSVLLSVHPALERAIGAQMHRPIGPGLLAKFGGPVGFSAASRRDIESHAQVLGRSGDRMSRSVRAGERR